jgi:uncharacterized protein YaaQ
MPALLDAGLEVYAIASSGGLLGHRHVALMIAAPEGTDAVLRVVLDNYALTRTERRTAGLSEAVERTLGSLAPAPLDVTVAGAVVFGLRVAHHETW